MKRRRRSRSLAYKQNAPVGIGASSAETDAAATAHRNAVIAATRVAVFNRDDRCRGACRTAHVDDEMHEVEPRSLLRNQPPETIFNTRNCIRVCRVLHGYLTKHEAAIVFVDAQEGCDAAVVFTGRGCV